MATKEVTIIIEQFDNGITFRWAEKDAEIDVVNKLIMEDNINEEVGKEIFSDIKDLMDRVSCNKVRLEIKYEPIRDNINLKK